MIGAPRSFSSRFISVSSVVIVFCTTMISFASRVRAESPMPHTTHTTMVVLSERPLDSDQWTALAAELHRGSAEAAALMPEIGSDIDVFEAGDAPSSLSALQRISIFLKGNCSLMPRSRTFVEGALGWVNEVHGRILPYVYVDCERIVEMLGPLALGMSRERRNTVMAEAIARVVFHEWVHIATQEAKHGDRGITQPEFKVKDLLANDEPTYPRQRVRHDRKQALGF